MVVNKSFLVMVVDMLVRPKGVDVMFLFHDKLVIGIFSSLMLLAATAYFGQNSVQSSMASDLVQFSKLSNADIDNIIAIKAKMQAARIQANLSL